MYKWSLYSTSQVRCFSLTMHPRVLTFCFHMQSCWYTWVLQNFHTVRYRLYDLVSDYKFSYLIYCIALLRLEGKTVS
jgi:hypothetical protein